MSVNVIYMKETDSLKKLVKKHLGYPGAIISGSKSSYRERNPKNITIFNAQVCIIQEKRATLIWGGDIDVTLSREKLKSLAAELKTDVYVYYESEPKIDSASADVFVYRASPNGFEIIGNRMRGYELS